MLYTKKTTVIILASIVLGGGAWYLNTTGVFDGISSSVLTSPFDCTQDNLRQQASTYRAALIRLRKAVAIQTQLESEIGVLKTDGKTDEMQKQQETLRMLLHQIGTYNHFIKAYSACQATISLVPETTTPSLTSEIASTTGAPAVTGNTTGSNTTIPPTTRENPITQPVTVTEVVPNMIESVPTTEAPSTTVSETTSSTTEVIPETTQSESTTEIIVPEITQVPADTAQSTPSAEV
ncbi:MAG: hypothetical protein WCK88_05350 [bacterium]